MSVSCRSGARIGTGAPQQGTAIGIHDVDATANRISSTHADRVLPGVVATAKDQHVLGSSVQLEAFDIRCRPGLAHFSIITDTALDDPAQFRAVAVGDIDREDITATAALTEVQVDMVAGIVEVTVKIGIFNPGHDVAIEAVGLTGNTAIVKDSFQVSQQLLRHEGKVLIACVGVYPVQVTVIGSHVGNQVGIAVGDARRTVPAQVPRAADHP